VRLDTSRAGCLEAAEAVFFLHASYLQLLIYVYVYVNYCMTKDMLLYAK